MTLKQTILENQTKAMKAREKETVSVLRSLHAAIKQVEIDTRKELTDEDVQQIVARQVKQLQDPIADFESAGRSDLADQHRSEIKILSTFLPEQLSDDELEKIIDTAVAQAGENPNFGQLMGSVMKQVSGTADGNRVRTILQKKLA